MTWGEFSFPKAILHIDGDSFFASCEVALDPSLKGLPVVTGSERGIVSSMTYEAKQLGISRAMPMFEVKKKFPQVVIRSSDYETYTMFSERMYAIVRRYTPAVEEYSIDECFADLTGLRGILHMSYPEIAAAIKHDLQSELGMTFSLGLGPTKVLAKIGSRMKKPLPDGLTVISRNDLETLVGVIPVGKVWGIGPQTSAYLQKLGISTIRDFVSHDERWVSDRLSKPYVALWKELQGISVLPLSLEEKTIQASIQKTRTFTPATTDQQILFAQISKNIENACIKLRSFGLSAKRISFFFKTQEFRYHGMELRLAGSVCTPSEIVKVVHKYAPQIIRSGVRYRASGVTLSDFYEVGTTQHDLFGESVRVESVKKVYEAIDNLSARYGKHIVYLGSSARALEHRGDFREKRRDLLSLSVSRKRLSIPFLGEVV